MIRKFQKADTEQVMKIWLHGNLDAHPFIPKEYWESNFDMVQEQMLQAEVYVYEVDGSIQGFIGIQGDYIAGIFVKQECRGTGVGRQLLDFAKTNHAVLTLNVYQKNSSAVEFYQWAGFSMVSEAVDPDTDQVDITMSWRGTR